ncbi:MAG: LPXTG cell wall anchor domain-containing protein [Candidatus Enteromonas sp.]|nr:LPXTG cell wall anchor domain-containing protein [Candidatus Enteromonas sp.]
MKKRNLILGLAAMAMSAGALATVVAVNANEPAIQTKADISKRSTIYLKVNENWKKDNARFAAYFYVGDKNAWSGMTQVENQTDLYRATVPNGGYTTVIFCRMNPNTTENNWNNRWTETGSLALKDVPDDGNTYMLKDDSWGEGTWRSVYNVTLNVLKDGAYQQIQSQLEYPVAGQKYYPQIHKKGVRYDWYSDEARQTKFSPSILDKDLTLYGTATALENDDYFYVTQSSHIMVFWSAYAFNTESTLDEHLGSWPGLSLQGSNEVVDMNPTADSVKIGGADISYYKVPFSSGSKDNKIIINNGLSGDKEKKTKDLDLVSKSLLYWDGSADGVVDGNKGKIVDFVLRVKSAINDAESKSVCNVNKETASALVGEYDTFTLDAGYSEEQLKFLKDSSIMTYESTLDGREDWVGIEQIVGQLRAIANSKTNSLNHTGMNASGDQTTGFVVAGVSVLGLIAVGGVFLLRKKKEN